MVYITKLWTTPTNRQKIVTNTDAYTIAAEVDVARMT